MNSTFWEKAVDFPLAGGTFFLKGDESGSTHAGGEMRNALRESGPPVTRRVHYNYGY